MTDVTNFSAAVLVICLPGNDPGWELRKAGDLAGAEAVARKALAEHVKEHGKSHHGKLPFLDSLSLTLFQGRRFAEAMPFLKESARTSERHLGAAHDATVSRCANLGIISVFAGQNTEGLKILRKVRDLRASKLGQDHKLTLMAMGNIAIALAQAGEMDQAVHLFRDVLTGMARSQPADGPDLAAARKNLELAMSLASGQTDKKKGMDA
ncbi:MAG: tetratricopeptide repeat protein [Deltaproteobacteria bacterium]|jgi:hypothetical protein|nr:tetratricopeptide repeat protein [Deltaproteobacteria bacterium]